MNNKSTINQPNDRSDTGVPGLDDVLGGGFVPHRLYLIEGDPGAGKTTLSLQYLLHGMKTGEKGLYITLSETREELIQVARSHGWSLEGLEIVELVASEKNLAGDEMLTMYHPSEVELGETTKAVLDAVERVKPARVVFDSLSELRLLAQSSLRYRRQILALKQFFVGRDATVLLLDDRTAEGSDSQLQSIAHGVLTLEQLAPEYGAERRRLRVMKMRGSQYRGGYHDFCIKPGGLRIYPRLIASEHGESRPREQVRSGVVALDRLLCGGIARGTSTLLLGPAGTGKSTVALQYAVAAAGRGEHAAIFSFEENPKTLKDRAEALGLHFEGGDGPGQVAVLQIDPAEVSPGEFASLVRESVERRDARVVVIDSLNGYFNAMPEEKFLTLQLHEILSYLDRRSVTTFLVAAQHGILGVNMAAPVDASYLADSVLLFRYFELHGEVRRAVSVIKKRSGAHERSIREMTFDAHGIHLGEPLRNFRGVLTGLPTPIESTSDALVGGDEKRG